jgi:ABC-2 type transport system ATP-binding protein
MNDFAMTASPPIVRLDRVSKSFGSHKAVDALSLQVPPGSIYGFIGPNGSGKTTTLRMILHIFMPDSGTVEVLGSTGTRAANDQIGYLPEERGLYKKMSVKRLLVYYAQLKGMSRVDASSAADSWLSRLGLSEWKNKKVEALSKGMAQKVQFISTVLGKPKLLILDEPFSGLDPVNMEALRSSILDLRREGTTIIFSTHDMPMAETMCDFICMIFKGKKVLDGTLASIQQSYGQDTIRVRVEGGIETLKRIPGVTVLRDLGHVQELVSSGDPQKLLRELSSTSKVDLFEVAHPSLHDIFIRIASGGEQKGESNV